MPSPRSGIYAIRHVESGKLYIGSATNIWQRWSKHRLLLSRGCHDNRHLQRAWDKFGATAFVFEIVEVVGHKADLIRVEQEWLDQIRPYDRGVGYNICKTAGSTLGVRASDETKAKLSQSLTGRKLHPDHCAKISAALSRRVTKEETREKLSKSHTGKTYSAESRAKMSASHKGQRRTPEAIAKMVEANRGQKRSDESRAKMSEAAKRRYARERAEQERLAADQGVLDFMRESA